MFSKKNLPTLLLIRGTIWLKMHAQYMIEGKYVKEHTSQYEFPLCMVDLSTISFTCTL